jgi:hypothetical protein
MAVALLRTRDSYYSESYTLLLSDEALKLEVLIHDAGEKVYLIGFKGKAVRLNFHYWYRDRAKAVAYAEEFLNDARKRDLEKKQSREQADITLEVGDILVSSWGWEQTNIDYYQVIERVGKCSVRLREVAKEMVENDRINMTGKCVPMPGHYVSELFTRRVVNGKGVNISSFQYARKKDYTLVEGLKIYAADSWTAYA